MVKRTKYIPKKGDLVWLNFTPQACHEQKGRRPALVLSPKEYNTKTGLAIFCPITSKIKSYPFEVEVSGKQIKGAILSDQIKNLDWTMREAEFIESLAKSTFNAVLDNIQLLLFSGEK